MSLTSKEVPVSQAIQMALGHHQAGRLPQAEAIYQQILKADPNHPDALHFLGVIAKQVGKYEIAVELIGRALSIKPDCAEAHNNLGNVFQAQARLGEAVACYDRALALKQDYAEAHNNLGNALYGQGKLIEAVASYRQALALKPDYAAAHNSLGMVLQGQGKLIEAVASYHQALALKPDNADAHNNLGNAFQSQGQLDEAVASYHQALLLKPDFAEAYSNLGNALQAQGLLDKAVESFRQALALKPDYADAYNNLGNALKAQDRLDEAVASYGRALALKPDYAVAHNNLGIALQDQGKPDEAVIHYREALAANPDYAEAHNNLGNALQGQDKLDEAVAHYHQALALRPDYADAHNNLGNVLQGRGRHDEAIAHYRKALESSPDNAGVYCNLGNTLQSQGKLGEAVDYLRTALSIKPNLPEAHYNLGNVLRDQGELDEAVKSYEAAIAIKADYAEAAWCRAVAQVPLISIDENMAAQSRAAFKQHLIELGEWFDANGLDFSHRVVGSSQPFYLAFQEENNRDLLSQYGVLCVRLMGHWQEKQKIVLNKIKATGKIRVGIFSAHFHDHPVWNAITKGWIQRFDRNRFQLHLFNSGIKADKETVWAASQVSTFEHGSKGLRDWVELIDQKQLNVLIYPEIGMDALTLRLASLRLAPVQIASWGHPETTGLPTIDYYLSAEGFEPPNAQECYTERLINLPNLGCTYPLLSVVPTNPDWSELGINLEIPVLLCPGTPFKYAPQHDFLFVEIARRLERCQLVFFTPCQRLQEVSKKFRQRLELAFAEKGLRFDDYVIFIPWLERSAFYGLMTQATVFLDTVGFSGFNTAMQAIECGLPIVTREGRFMRGRFASGILQRMGLQELIGNDSDGYIELAVKIVKDAEYRRHLRRRIEMARGILFNDTAPVKALEDFITRCCDTPAGA